MDQKTEAEYWAELCRAWELYETTKAALDDAREELERLKKNTARLRPALEETIKTLEIISQQAGESRGLSTFTQIKQYAFNWVRTVRKDLAAREAR